MQSNGTRLAAAIVAVGLVIVLFFVFKGGDDGGDSTIATTATTGSASEPKKSDEPSVPTITIKDGQPEGGVADLTFNKGDQVQFVVDSDTADEVHVHGYDIMEDVEAGGTVEFDFTADIDGVFEIELEGSTTQIAELTVNP